MPLPSELTEGDREKLEAAVPSQFRVAVSWESIERGLVDNGRDPDEARTVVALLRGEGLSPGCTMWCIAQSRGPMMAGKPAPL